MGILATSRGPVPNVINCLGDHGILIIRAGGRYYLFNADNWIPAGGLNNRQFIKRFHQPPPSNIAEGHWGIVGGLTDTTNACKDSNWAGSEIQAALDMFVDKFRQFTVSSGVSVRPLRSRPLTFGQMDKMIQAANVDLQASRVHVQ